jgi:LDH2 family malate/lactate/ureidoglycolate dehydrogenase
MDQKEQETREGPPAPGFERVAMPGDGTHERMAMYRENGVPLTDEVYADLLAAAGRYGVSPETFESGSIPRGGTQQ